jgi:glycyl-tRNA synthetase (class II)
MAAGHRYQWRKKLVACERCKAWFHCDKLIYYTPERHVALGLIPDHRSKGPTSRRS